MGENFEFDFEKLTVYQRTLEFIDKIFEVHNNLSQEYRYSIGNNLVRAGLSIANNLAEGNGKKSKKEKDRYFGIALDSARECISVFNVLKRQQLIEEDKYSKIRSDGREITNMIWGLINSSI